MTLEEQKQSLVSFQERMTSVLVSKGDDYANEDRLSNFKMAGSISGLDAKRNCLTLIATKVARLGVLLNGKTPKNEPIRDSILDLANYAALLDMIISEESKTVRNDE